MAFIDNNMAVISNQIRNGAPSNQALHEGNIDDPSRPLLPAMDDSKAARRDVQECLQPCYPLLEELSAMDQNQGIPPPCGDHFRGDNSSSNG